MGKKMEKPNFVTKKEEEKKLEDMFEVMKAQEEEAKSMGIMNMSEFDERKEKMAADDLKKTLLEQELQSEELAGLYNETANKINRIVRGYIGRRRAIHRRNELAKVEHEKIASVIMQSVVRMFLAKCRVHKIREKLIQELIQQMAASTI